MAKKYIKNCTGGEKEEKKSSAFSKAVSKAIFYVLLAAFVAVSFFILFFSGHLKIASINISGNQELDGQELQQMLKSNLEGKYLGLVPKNNFLFISKKRTGSILSDKYKKIRSVEVQKKFPDTININIDEREALLVWCSGGECFLIDEKGTAYSNADFNSPELSQNHLIQIEDRSGRTISAGENIIEPSYEEYALSVKNALKEVGFDVNQYYTPSNMANEINVKTEQGTELYFSTEFQLNSAISTLSVVLKKEISDDQKKNLDYIDLRSENKIFYKIKSAESEENKEENKAEENKN